MRHDLKCWPPYFEHVLTGRKTFECRSIRDRQFSEGDTLLLREYDGSLAQRQPETEGLTGRTCERIVTYILGDGDWGIEEDTVILGLAAPTPPALDALERWMVDYEGEEGGPVETKLSWITGPDGDPTTRRPDVGDYLVRLDDVRKLLAAQSPALDAEDRERLEEMADDFESRAAKRFRGLQDLSHISHLHGKEEGEGEAFATAANKLRELLASHQPEPQQEGRGELSVGEAALDRERGRWQQRAEKLETALQTALGTCQEVAHEVEDPNHACAEIEGTLRAALDLQGEGE